MILLTERQIADIVDRLSTLQIALIKANEDETRNNNYITGLRCYHDLSYGIKDIVIKLAGSKGYEQYAAKVLPHIMTE